MKNAFLRYSSTCAALLVAGVLAVTVASAATRNLATVTFSQPVAVGAATLPAGEYTIANTGGDAFIVQSLNGDDSAMIVGRRVDTDSEAARTSVTLSTDGATLHLDKLSIAGEPAEYQFGR
jgi:hypothetical protein